MMPSQYNTKPTDAGTIVRRGFGGTPMLSAAAGVTLIAGGCVSGLNALVLLLMLAVLLPFVAIAVAAERSLKFKLAEPVRPFIYCLMTTVAVFGLSLLFDRVIIPGSVINLGIYAPLLAFDGLVLYLAGERAAGISPAEAVLDGMGVLLSFGMAALPVALVREVLGSGSIFSLSLGFSGAPAFRSPFAGFILCGFALTLIRRMTVAE